MDNIRYIGLEKNTRKLLGLVIRAWSILLFSARIFQHQKPFKLEFDHLSLGTYFSWVIRTIIRPGKIWESSRMFCRLKRVFRDSLCGLWIDYGFLNYINVYILYITDIILILG